MISYMFTEHTREFRAALTNLPVLQEVDKAIRAVGRAEEEVSWENFLRVAPNPLVPPFGRILTEALDPHENETLANRLRDQVDARRSRRAGAYLSAQR